MRSITRSLFTMALGICAISPVLKAVNLTSQPGAVFVMTNDANHNAVVAYSRDQYGSLYSAGWYLTGGRGSGGITDPLQSQGSLVLSNDHSFLFAANAGSGDISVFRVRHASLFLVERAPSGGAEPVAVAQWQNLVYVLNTGGAGNIVGFRLGFGGQLNPVRNSTKYLTGTGAGGASLAITPDGKHLVVTERVTNNIDTFPINADGTLGTVVTTASANPGVFAAAIDPKGDVIVSETGPAGAANGSTISSYTILASGALSPVSAAVPTLGAANCWNAITPDGKWVYVSNAASATISGFAIGQGGVLTPAGGTVVGVNPQGSTNIDIAITADGKYFYSLNSGTGNISIFAIQQDGTLNNLGDAGNLPQSAGYNGIAAL